MTVKDIADNLNFKILTGDVGLNKHVSGVYICDLLSLVISKAKAGDIWITVLTNINVVAVATLAEVSCIVIPEDIEIEDTTINKAISEGIPVLSSNLTSYEISKLLGRIF